MESCGMSLIKYLLFIFNLIFALSGLGIIIAGAIVLSDLSDYDQFVTKDIIGPPIVLIVAGVIVFIIAFLGCFGAIRESRNMLFAFAVLLIIIFIVEMAVGIAAAVYKADFKDALKNSLKNSMKGYSNPSKVEQIAWDNLQNRLMCCGVENANDWSGQTTPISCCAQEKLGAEGPNPFCSETQPDKPYLKDVGCYEKMQIKIESNTKILIGVGIGIAFIEIVGVVLALWLAYTIKQEQSSK